jgi:hypothetical protein
VDTFQSAFQFPSRTEAFLIDYKLGLDKLSEFDLPSLFWLHIHNHLRTLPSKSSRPITKLLLAGESVTHDRFLDVLKDALAGLSGHDYRTELNIASIVNPVFAAARGAATYARRRQEVPFDCAEPKRCEEKRRRQRGNVVPIKSELK